MNYRNIKNIDQFVSGQQTIFKNKSNISKKRKMMKERFIEELNHYINNENQFFLIQEQNYDINLL